jgi:hypothetical protein
MIHMWKKTQTQLFINQLRKAGYEVQRTPQGYTCFCEHDNGDVDSVFTALQGARGYIVRLNEKYFTRKTGN